MAGNHIPELFLGGSFSNHRHTAMNTIMVTIEIIFRFISAPLKSLLVVIPRTRAATQISSLIL